MQIQMHISDYHTGPRTTTHRQSAQLSHSLCCQKINRTASVSKNQEDKIDAKYAIEINWRKSLVRPFQSQSQNRQSASIFLHHYDLHLEAVLTIQKNRSFVLPCLQAATLLHPSLTLFVMFRLKPN